LVQGLITQVASRDMTAGSKGQRSGSHGYNVPLCILLVGIIWAHAQLFGYKVLAMSTPVA